MAVYAIAMGMTKQNPRHRGAGSWFLRVGRLRLRSLMSTPPPADHSRFRHLQFRGEPPARALLKPPRRASRARPLGPGLAAPGARAQHALPASHERFLQIAFRLAGLEMGRYRLPPLSRRLAACARALRCDTIEQATQRLQDDPKLLPLVLNTLLIGVTSFFRDAAVFERLHRGILPRLLRSPRPLRVWSIGCSDGAELYSVAIQLSEHNALSRVELLGTDCRSDAIARASAGRYHIDAIAHLPVEIREKYFFQRAREAILTSPLRAAARWRVQDLFVGGDWGTWDLILCRNLPIYLDASAAQMMWQRVAAALPGTGVLVVGRAEKPPAHLFQQTAACMFGKR